MEFPVSSMTTAEKIEAMEQLWISLRGQADYWPPDWHAEVLAERQRKIDRGEASFSTLEEVRQRVAKARR